MSILYGIYTTDCEGKVLVYTGKAGADWLSRNVSDIFLGYSKQGAEYKCERLQKLRPSLTFHVHDPDA